MSQTPQPGTLTDRLTDGVFRALLAGLGTLPYERRVAAMGALMARGIGPLAGWQRRARRQIAWINPGWTPRKVRATARASADNAGRTLMELYSPRDFPARMAQTPITGPGLPLIEEARQAGRPVLFVTGHFGNHEAPRHALLARGFEIGGLYRPMKNPFFNDHYARTMTDHGGPVFAQGRKGTIGFARHLGAGGMATLLFDVWVGEGEPIPFLGQPAPTSLASADMALRAGALMVPYFGTRRADGVSFDIEIEAPIPHSDPLTMMGAATARLEARIRAHPGQWFWTHRRWKPERRKG